MDNTPTSISYIKETSSFLIEQYKTKLSFLETMKLNSLSFSESLDRLFHNLEKMNIEIPTQAEWSFKNFFSNKKTPPSSNDGFSAFFPLFFNHQIKNQPTLRRLNEVVKGLTMSFEKISANYKQETEKLMNIVSELSRDIKNKENEFNIAYGQYSDVCRQIISKKDDFNMEIQHSFENKLNNAILSHKVLNESYIRFYDEIDNQISSFESCDKLLHQNLQKCIEMLHEEISRLEGLRQEYPMEYYYNVELFEQEKSKAIAQVIGNTFNEPTKGLTEFHVNCKLSFNYSGLVDPIYVLGSYLKRNGARAKMNVKPVDVIHLSVEIGDPLMIDDIVGSEVMALNERTGEYGLLSLEAFDHDPNRKRSLAKVKETPSENEIHVSKDETVVILSVNDGLAKIVTIYKQEGCIQLSKLHPINPLE